MMMDFFLQYQINSADIREHRSSVAEHFPNVKTETKAYTRKYVAIHFPYPCPEQDMFVKCKFECLAIQVILDQL